MIHKKQTEELTDKGRAYLEKHEFEKALEVAKELEALRYTAAFEIAAQAYAGMEELHNAIQVLERGVRVAPECWLNWQLLGNYRSENGDFDGATHAYHRALACEHVWESSVYLNLAILASRQENHDEVFHYLDRVVDKELEFHATEIRIGAFARSGQQQEAIALAQEVLQANPAENEPQTGDVLARIAAELCRIRLQRNEPEDVIKTEVIAALAYDPSNAGLLGILRDIDNQYSERAQYFRLLFHGKFSPSHPYAQEVAGYFATYDIVADSPEEAMIFAQQLEGEGDDVSFEIDSADALEPRPTEPKGVYWRSGRCFYEREG